MAGPSQRRFPSAHPSTDGPPQSVVAHPRINLCRGNLSVSEGSLYEVQVAGLLLEPGGGKHGGRGVQVGGIDPGF